MQTIMKQKAKKTQTHQKQEHFLFESIVISTFYSNSLSLLFTGCRFCASAIWSDLESVENNTIVALALTQ